MYKQLASAALFAAGVNAHGHLVSPEPRPLGSAMEAACGTQVYDMMSSDENGNIQTMAQTGASQSDYNATACHLWQCRGYQFGDATSSTIHSYSAGQTLDFTVDIAAPHTGVANVSVINLAENAVIGDPLISFTNYASTATGVAANNTAFSVTLPDSLPDVCSTSGGCALQWWWDARSIDQTYMSCADFVWTGASSSSSSSSSSASSAVASSAAASSTVAASSSSAATVAASSAVASSTSSCSKKRAARRAALAARKN
ncbi:hypothetical protein BD289DRAFT_361892 [Coniella lustricola]|uniref:Chitin-binding type-4 domain-containing protein n=1 Tax=Coniella lustricola TaxID=2025994 RepID=A0A2T3AHK7_9PEZI|nr:hypothetical protein BD289DRAFT_361892 [Coniella lustricola]